MSTWVEGFRDGYSPGGIPAHRRRRESARRAGRLSGRRRRQLAWARRGHAGNPGKSLQLSYELRQPSRREFDARYEKLWPRPERPTAEASWERGRETVWTHLMASWRLVCVEGQHCRTTKPQRAAALSARGRERCPRTIRRVNQKLEALGLAGFSHWRAPRGRKDCLVLEWRVSRRIPKLDVTPPSGTVNPGVQPGGLPTSEPEIAPSPPAPADDVGPPCGGHRQITEKERDRSRVAFLEAKLRSGFYRPCDETELRRLRARATAGCESPRAADEDSGYGCNAP